MSAWEEIEQAVEENDAKKGTWLKLPNPGDKAVVVFLGEPFKREVCFVDGKTVPYDDAAKARGLKPQLKVSFNVALYATREVKVLERTSAFFKDLVLIRKKFKGLHTWAFEITRIGSGLETEYKILPDTQLSPEEQQTFAALELHDLKALYAGKGGDDERPSSPAPDVSFKQVVDILAKLPRSYAENFCRTMRVGRVSDIPAAELGRALAMARTIQIEYEQEVARMGGNPGAEEHADFNYGYNEPDAIRPEQPTRPEGVR